MDPHETGKKLCRLQKKLEGDLFFDPLNRVMYATDASAYREIPLGVARPRSVEDLKKLIAFAREEKVPLIPRAAGTSLAGQVVGSGLVVDISRYMTKILEINREEHWIRVQPGVILDELNKAVEPLGLFFGPETSTSSRCMIGGMVGNNSCGAHSILYGSTRDHVISVKAILSDGTETEFRELSTEEFLSKTRSNTTEGQLYRQINEILSDKSNQVEIRKEYPDPAIHRRNTGYAIDLLLETDPFTGNGVPFNFSRLIAGSEGTLAFITEVVLNLVPLPPKEKGLICVHCLTVGDALQANLIALKYSPGSVELMDKAVMDCTKDNITQRKNRFFIDGDPGAILIVEFARDSRKEIHEIAVRMEEEMRKAGLGYHFPVVYPPDLKRVWDLRKAGLGVLSNYPGDRKPVPVTEDTAVSPEVLPAYIRDFDRMLNELGLNCVYYAHVGSGELHLRPVLNLKNPGDVELFHTVALETAKLVKKYKGSLSGEHGDGRLRGEFIPLMIGERNYSLLKQIKETWDPACILNPGKIIDTPKMNTYLRYSPGQLSRDIPTIFDFSSSHGILRAAEQCNGSGDCRNTVNTGRWMCPSYMSMQEEDTTTRARANVLREFLTTSTKKNPFSHKEIKEVMDLCLSCKACKSECPSNVDIAKLKAEFLQHYYDSRGVPLRSLLIAYFSSFNKLGSHSPGVYNFFLKNRFLNGIFKSMIGFAPERSIPVLYPRTLRSWAGENLADLNHAIREKKGAVCLFVDEFTEYNDVKIGIDTILLLTRLGYEVILTDHGQSGRTFLSKGLLRKARSIAMDNVTLLRTLIGPALPLIGIEPSAILGFRDEYPDLLAGDLREDALHISKYTLTLDEFIAREIGAGNITSDQFTTEPLRIRLHGHCHQKALSSVEPTIKMLSLPVNYRIEEIRSGCCGMAGSFGFEKEHYSVSMKVGELVLFPEIRKEPGETVIVAPGTSCRHQILEGTGRTALHPSQVLLLALK